MSVSGVWPFIEYPSHGRSVGPETPQQAPQQPPQQAQQQMQQQLQLQQHQEVGIDGRRLVVVKVLCQTYMRRREQLEQSRGRAGTRNEQAEHIVTHSRRPKSLGR